MISADENLAARVRLAVFVQQRKRHWNRYLRFTRKIGEPDGDWSGDGYALWRQVTIGIDGGARKLVPTRRRPWNGMAGLSLAAQEPFLNVERHLDFEIGTRLA